MKKNNVFLLKIEKNNNFYKKIKNQNNVKSYFKISTTSLNY